MFPGMSEAEVRVAEFRFREMRNEARARRLLGHDAGGRLTGGQTGPMRRLCASTRGIVAQITGRRAATEVRQGAPALREGTAS